LLRVSTTHVVGLIAVPSMLVTFLLHTPRSLRRKLMDLSTEPNWKNVAENFWYAAFHGDNDLMEHMIERYTDWFDEDDADVE